MTVYYDSCRRQTALPLVSSTHQIWISIILYRLLLCKKNCWKLDLLRESKPGPLDCQLYVTVYSYNITYRQQFGTVLYSAFTRIVATESTGDALLQGHWPISSRVSLSLTLSLFQQQSVVKTPLSLRSYRQITVQHPQLLTCNFRSFQTLKKPTLSKWKYKHYLLERKCFRQLSLLSAIENKALTNNNVDSLYKCTSNLRENVNCTRI